MVLTFISYIDVNLYQMADATPDGPEPLGVVLISIIISQVMTMELYNPGGQMWY